ncbi:hypothetical protein BJ912DRAFT_1064413 [Pholiota molesta]|nr:hypothetical protein BJ912DRAFT_1064413 [Pholiota molesta]
MHVASAAHQQAIQKAKALPKKTLLSFFQHASTSSTPPTSVSAPGIVAAAPLIAAPTIPDVNVPSPSLTPSLSAVQLQSSLPPDDPILQSSAGSFLLNALELLASINPNLTARTFVRSQSRKPRSLQPNSRVQITLSSALSVNTARQEYGSMAHIQKEHPSHDVMLYETFWGLHRDEELLMKIEWDKLKRHRLRPSKDTSARKLKISDAHSSRLALRTLTVGGLDPVIEEEEPEAVSNSPSLTPAPLESLTREVSPSQDVEELDLWDLPSQLALPAIESERDDNGRLGDNANDKEDDTPHAGYIDTPNLLLEGSRRQQKRNAAVWLRRMTWFAAKVWDVVVYRHRTLEQDDMRADHGHMDGGGQTVTFLDHGPFTNVEVPEDCAFIGQPAVASYNTCIALPKIRASFTNYALWTWKWNWPVGAQREDAYREPACLGKHFEVDEHLTKWDGKSIQKIRESFDPFFRDAKSKAKTQWESAAQEFKKIIIQGHLRLMNSEMKAGWDALGSDKRNEWDKKAENLKASEEFDLSQSRSSSSGSSLSAFE